MVAFGGSFGGTLTTFLRASHPEVVVGGLAASAPIGYYDKEGWAAHGIDEFTWYDIVLKDYDEADPMCTDAITKTISAIKEYPPEKSVTAFHVCDAAALGSSTDPSEYFVYALEGIPQGDYPYVTTLPFPLRPSTVLLLFWVSNRVPLMVVEVL